MAPEDDAGAGSGQGFGEDSTVLDDLGELRGGGDAGPLHLAWRVDDERREATFHDAFTLGRDPSCDVPVSDASVSRSHARLAPRDGLWHLEDLDSANGTFLDDLRVRQALIPRSASLQLGRGLRIRLDAPQAPEALSPDELRDRYFGDARGEEIGGRTELLRGAFEERERQRRNRYRGLLAVVALALVLSSAFGLQQYRALQQTRALATEIFYSMKAIEVQIARLEDRVRESGDAELLDEVARRRREVRALEAQYDRFLEELDVLGSGLSEKDRVILRVARIFGECELTMPPAFVEEVKRYIHEWRLSPRLRRAIARMHDQELGPLIAEAMLAQDLPPQYLYVALQESSFDPDAVGPRTRFGIAKGMWQFIPSTARRYGLRTGPLVELPVPDPNDDRHDPPMATRAAARYLRDIYARDAQASGLLVMASYNWGPNNVRRRIRQMPDNPRERNFWKLLEHGDIPRETYDYVFHIVAAIVIGEEPALFGFDFENPLESLDEDLAAES